MPGAGPVRVITDRGILKADPELGGELVLTAIFPGISVDDVRPNVGWDLVVEEPVEVLEPPSGDVLRVLRDKLDPGGRYLSG